MSEVEKLYEVAKKAIDENGKRRYKSFFSRSLNTELKVYEVSVFEMAELLDEHESYSKWIDRVIYEAISELKAIAKKLLEEGKIREECEVSKVFSLSEKERIYGILVDFSESGTDISEVEELKNS